MNDVTPAPGLSPVERVELIPVNGRKVAATVAVVAALSTYGGIWGGGRVEVKPKGKPSLVALERAPGGGFLAMF